MAVIRFRDPFSSDPYSAVRSLRENMDRLFNEFFTGGAKSQQSGVFPQVNVYTGEDAFFVTAEIPGVDMNHMDISVQANNLTLKGERKLESSGKQLTYHRRERAAGTFSRVVSLPQPINASEVSAEYKNGVLTLKLPIAEEAKPRKIEIRA